MADEASRLFPERLIFRLKRSLTLPVVYGTEQELEDRRTRFALGLEEVERELRLETRAQREDACSAIAAHENFLLCYQMRDDRELQVRYSDLVRRILEARYPELYAFQPAESRTSGRIRVGYISPHLHRHSVSKAYAGWILGCNREEFETFVYHVSGNEDTRDDILRGADHVRSLAGGVDEIAGAIRDDRLDAVIFLDVGMHPTMAMLAAVRLAPTQCVTWGHPVTDRRARKCDFFLSSDLMEPADAQRCYSEQLVRLPGVGVYYPKPVIPSRNPRSLARAGSVWARIERFSISSQSTFKYVPEHDDIFARIAKEVPSAQFVFVASRPPVAEAFRRRLDRAFRAEGLAADDFCVILPFLDFFDYLSLTLAGDVYLDPPGFSGFNMALEAMACGLAVVTWPGEFLRGRLAYGALTQLGVPETIARDKDDYVAIAARLGRDPGWRRQITERMAENESRLFSDAAPIAALGEFLAGLRRALKLSW